MKKISFLFLWAIVAFFTIQSCRHYPIDLIPTPNDLLYEITGFENNLYQHRDWNIGKTMVLGSGNSKDSTLTVIRIG